METYSDLNAKINCVQHGNLMIDHKPTLEKIVLSRELGCCVHTIVSIMLREETEHKYGKFGVTYLKYRKIVIEWMIDVCDYFGLHATTTHAAIAYLDRLQPNEKYSRFEWQMLAICCILIASKYNESEEDVPDLATLEEITQQQISNESVLNYELWALQRLGWGLTARTTMAFLSCFSSIGVLFRTDRIAGLSLESAGLEYTQIEEQFKSLSAMCILNESFKPINCSVLAAAIVLYTRRTLRITPEWNSDLVKLTTYETESLLDVVNQFHVIFENTKDVSAIDIPAPSSPISSCIQATEKMSFNSPEPDVTSTDEFPYVSKRDDSRRVSPISIAQLTANL